MPSSSRTILHADMDAFYASVEQRDHPQWRNQPLLVGHDGSRGVVSAASYEARKFGCRSAQPMAVAKRLCPHAIVAPNRMAVYRAVSNLIFDVFDQFSPAVEPLSIDEAFLDLTGTARLLGPAIEVAQQIKDRVRAATSLTVSIGIAPNKFLAKLASDLKKPEGLVQIDAATAADTLAPLSVSRLWGIGAVAEERLARLGVTTIGDLRSRHDAWFINAFGNDGARLRALCFGIDDRPVVPHRAAKSISQEQTFSQNIAEPDVLRDVLLAQAEEVGRRLRRSGLRTRTISLKIRFGQFRTITRAITLDAPTDLTPHISTAAFDLFDQWAARSFSPVRLIGVCAKSLDSDPAQPTLFVDPEHARLGTIDRTLDQIRAKFGNTAIHRGRGPNPEKFGVSDHYERGDEEGTEAQRH
jgi:DNA polymerase-4